MENQNNTTFNSDFCEYPVIKAVNGDNTFPPTNSLETNVGDMIIGTNDFTIETYIKFDDVNQDLELLGTMKHHAIVQVGYCIIVVTKKENNGEEGWFQWLVIMKHQSK